MYSGQKILDDLVSVQPESKIVASGDKSVIMVRSFFAEMKGVLQASQHLKLGLCLSGGGNLTYYTASESNCWLWRPGTTAVTAPNDDRCFTSPNIEMLGIALDLSKIATLNSEQNTVRALEQLPSRVINDKVVRSVAQALWLAGDFYESNTAFWDEGKSIILQRLLELAPSELSKSGGRCLNRRQISCLREFIDQHLTQDLRIQDLANALNMDERGFVRLFKASFGYAPYVFITQLRVARSQELLTQGGSVIDAALAVGYANPGKFSAAFRRVVGCTPSQWRRGHSRK